MSIKHRCPKCGLDKDEEEFPIVPMTGARSRYCTKCTNGSWVGEETKVCGDTKGRGCGRTLPVSAFGVPRGTRRDGAPRYKRLCKSCRNQLLREYRHTRIGREDTTQTEQWCAYHRRFEPIEAFAPSQRNSSGKYCQLGFKEYRRAKIQNKQTEPTEKTRKQPEPVSVCSYCGRPGGVVEIKYKTQSNGNPLKTLRCEECYQVYYIWYAQQPKNKMGQLISRDRNKNKADFMAFLNEYKNPKKITLLERILNYFRR